MKIAFALLPVALLVGCAHRMHVGVVPSVAEIPPQLPGYFPEVPRARFVYSSGEVNAPGRYDWSPGLTLRDVLHLAEGLTDFADRYSIEITHVDGTVHRLSYAEVELGTAAIQLRPDDRILTRRVVQATR